MLPTVPAMKRVVIEFSGHTPWQNERPPLTNLNHTVPWACWTSWHRQILRCRPTPGYERLVRQDRASLLHPATSGQLIPARSRMPEAELTNLTVVH